MHGGTNRGVMPHRLPSPPFPRACSVALLWTVRAQGSARLFLKGGRGERGQESNEDLRRTTPWCPFEERLASPLAPPALFCIKAPWRVEVVVMGWARWVLLFCQLYFEVRIPHSPTEAAARLKVWSAASSLQSSCWNFIGGGEGFWCGFGSAASNRDADGETDMSGFSTGGGASGLLYPASKSIIESPTVSL